MAAVAALRAERHFYGITGYRHLPLLAQALDFHASRVGEPAARASWIGRNIGRPEGLLRSRRRLGEDRRNRRQNQPSRPLERRTVLRAGHARETHAASLCMQLSLRYGSRHAALER